MMRPYYYDDPMSRRDIMDPWNQLARLDRDLFDFGRQLSLWDRDFSTLPNTFDRMMDRNFFPMMGTGRDFFPRLGSMMPGIEEHSGKYIVNVPLSRNLSPEDLKISMRDHVMTVQAKKEQKSDDGRSRSYEEYMQRFTLPQNVRMEDVKSVFTPEGYLKIEAPLPEGALPEPHKPMPIPIEYA